MPFKNAQQRKGFFSHKKFPKRRTFQEIYEMPVEEMQERRRQIFYTKVARIKKYLEFKKTNPKEMNELFLSAGTLAQTPQETQLLARLGNQYEAKKRLEGGELKE